jgi:hypothetical protein
MRFVLLAEGRTERDVVAPLLKRWLDPRLKQPVGFRTVKFAGWSDLVDEVAKKNRTYLSGPKEGEIIAVVGLLDLHGPGFYPADKTTAAARREWAVSEMQRRVGDPRFRMFFAVHEVEAWLLAQPAVLPDEVRNHLPRIAAKPEAVNFREPPAQMLDRLYTRHLNRSYKKTTDGKNLFPRLDPTAVYDACPVFAEMLDTLLELAKLAGL